MQGGPDDAHESALRPDDTLAGPPPLEPTGHDDVDRVLGAMDGIERRDIHEHVAVFEATHAALRRALDRAES